MDDSIRHAVAIATGAEPVSPLRYREEIGNQPTEKLRHRVRIIRALCGDKSDMEAWRTGLRINDCSKEYPCFSPFCPRCRHKFQTRCVGQIHEMMAEIPKSELAFLTILFPVTYDPQTLTTDMLDGWKRAWRQLVSREAKKDERWGGVRWFGSFEIDVKRPEDARRSDMAEKTLVGLGMDQSRTDAAFLPHLHMVVTLNGIDREAFRDTVAGKWPGHYQVRLQSLHSDKTKDENLANLACYISKYRLQYSENIDTGCDDGDVVGSESRRTSYRELYEEDIIRSCISLIGRLNGWSGMSFKSRYGGSGYKAHTESQYEC